MNAMQFYLALDLELNNAKDGSTLNPKIIQVGVAIGTVDHYDEKCIIKKKWYLDPHEPIFPFITELTGITDQDIREKAVSHQQVAKELGELIAYYKPFVNPVVWGGADSRELKQEMLERNVPFPYFGRREIDVKTWWLLHKISKSQGLTGGLRSALTYFKMHFEGEQHRADDDAFNTLRLFFKMIEVQSHFNQVIELVKRNC